METEIPASIAEAVPPFPSLAAMRSMHSELLIRQRETGNTAEFRKQLIDFIRCARATGALLDVDRDRSNAQTLIDYWVTFLYRITREEEPETILDEFNPGVKAKELSDEQFPYKPYQGT